MLNRDVVLEIRKRYDLGYSPGEIAEGYRVSETTVRNIGKRRTHKRVKEGSVQPYPYQKAPQRDEGRVQRARDNLMRRSKKNHQNLLP